MSIELCATVFSFCVCVLLFFFCSACVSASIRIVKRNVQMNIYILANTVYCCRDPEWCSRP